MRGVTTHQVHIYYDEVQGAVCPHLTEDIKDKIIIATISLGVILKMAEVDPEIYLAYPPQASMPFLKFMRALKGTRESMRLCKLCIKRLNPSK
jgi:hypothetical protein